MEAVVFGGDALYPPFEWLRGNAALGFHIDLERAIGEAGQRRIRHELGNWSDMVEALEAAQIDVLPMLISKERKEQFLFTSAIHHVYHAYYALPGSPTIQALEQLRGKRIAVIRLSYAHNKLINEDMDVLPKSNTLTALEAVSAGKADYAVLGTATADHLLDTESIELERIGPPIWPQEYAFAVRRDRLELGAWLQGSLNLVISSGQYRDIYGRWKDKLEPSKASFPEIVRQSSLVLVPLVLFVIMGGAWSVALRRTVKVRTVELRTELKRRLVAEERLRYFADYNTHTDLPERHHFVGLAKGILMEEVLDGSAEREVALIKLTELEDVIQTFGYHIEEQLVAACAHRIKNEDFDVRGYLGRGIFIVMCPSGNLSKCIEALSGHVRIGDLNLYPQLTIGVATWPTHSVDVERLVRRAETALAVALAHNQDWVLYDEAFEPDELSIRLVSDFRDINEAGIFPVLQPQVTLETGRIVAAEALVRWQHPHFGLVPPAKFIPILEKAGLIGRVTRRMIDEAARISKNLAEVGIDCTISVNVSAQDIVAEGLTDTLLDSLMRHSADPGKIKLELTETSIAGDIERVKTVLEELEQMGVKTSIDDFGTGYSSLSYLSALPIHELKVDQTFVRGMARNKRDYNIVRSTIALGHSLGLKVVAEGVEDQETVELLAGMGCDKVQGYVFAKPMTEDNFQEFIGKWKGPFIATA